MYILEGNIGAGKSTFLKLVEQHLTNTSVCLEPVDSWQSQIYGQSLLTNFYENPKRWAYTLENLAMICRVREHISEQSSSIPNRIVERSIYSGHYCFARNSYLQGFMTAAEWEAYDQWFAFLVQKKCAAPKGFIYLNVHPDVAYERIKKRNRLAEKTLTLKYLKQIDAQHQKFLIEKEHILPALKNVPVLILDCNKEFEADPVMLAEHLARVQEFLRTTQE